MLGSCGAEVDRRRRAGPTTITSFFAALAFSAFGTEAHACGPCDVPQLRDIQPLGEELWVVTNFGLLKEVGNGWQLACEEIMGGLLLSAQRDAEQALVSTDNGLYYETDDCTFTPGPQSENNDWLLAFSLMATEDSDSPAIYALVVDNQTQEILVERAERGADFSVVHRFGNTSGYRQLKAAAGPSSSVFVGGYGGDPRSYRVASSVDGVESWRETVMPTDGTFTLSLVDPRDPTGVFVKRQPPYDEPDELWYVDAVSGDASRLLPLAESEILTGIALDTDSIWVAARRSDAGSLYRAANDAPHASELRFERVVDSGPAFDCLAVSDGVLFTCINDFSYASDFMIGASSDGGLSWQPRLVLKDLGTVDSCPGQLCATTTGWLRQTFDAQSDGGMPFAGDASSAAKPGKPDSKPSVVKQKGCNVHTNASSKTSYGWLFASLCLLWYRRRQTNGP